MTGSLNNRMDSHSVEPIQNFHTLSQEGQKNISGWWKDLKNESAIRFSTQGLPKRKQEEWRYTDLSVLGKRSWMLADSITALESKSAPSHNLTQLKSQEENIYLHWKKRLDERFAGETLVDLNTLLTHSGQTHFIPEGQSAELYLSHSSKESEKIFSPYHFVHVGKNASLELGEEFLFQKTAENWINPCIDIVLEEGAKLDFYQLQENSLTTRQTSTVRLIQSRGSVVHAWAIQTGSKMARNSFFAAFAGEEAQFHYRALSMVQPDQHLDQYIYLDHAVPNCLSRQLFKGIVSERGRSIFNGRVMVRKYAQKTDAGQQSKNLLLGKLAEANARPQLEIYADDVKCTHGSTIGRLNKEELFYLQSRALSTQQATTLLCHGFAEDVIQDIPNLKQKAKLSAALTRAFEALHIGDQE
ncbi:MAG: Fe-S cluster assembly protein SufD [Bdellovibrionales bacterium]